MVEIYMHQCSIGTKAKHVGMKFVINLPRQKVIAGNVMNGGRRQETPILPPGMKLGVKFQEKIKTDIYVGPTEQTLMLTLLELF